jgi:hypothetical protein
MMTNSRVPHHGIGMMMRRAVLRVTATMMHRVARSRVHLAMMMNRVASGTTARVRRTMIPVLVVKVVLGATRIKQFAALTKPHGVSSWGFFVSIL